MFVSSKNTYNMQPYYIYIYTCEYVYVYIYICTYTCVCVCVFGVVALDTELTPDARCEKHSRQALEYDV